MIPCWFDELLLFKLLSTSVGDDDLSSLVKSKDLFVVIIIIIIGVECVCFVFL